MTEPVYYTRFTDQGIFESPELNVFMNQMFTFLINNLSENVVRQGLLLDREVALALQDVDVALIESVSFSTTNTQIFNLIRSSGTSLNISYVFLSTSDYIVLRFGKYEVIFRLLRGELELVDYSGIYIRDKKEIF